MVCFQTAEEVKTKPNNYGNEKQERMKLSRTFETTKRASKKKTCNKFSKHYLDDVTSNPEEWITNIKLLRRYPQKPGVQIYESEIMNHILLNLP